MVVRPGWLWLMRLYSRKRPGKHPMLLLDIKRVICCWRPLRGARSHHACGVLSIPLLLPDGNNLSQALLYWYFSPQV